MEHKLSVCIVAYNNYDDIRNAVRTIEEHTSREISKKLYIVDNSGDNENKNDFVKYLSSYPDIEYADTGENLGFGKGNNFILDRLDSEYHAIVNPDILLKEDSFSKIIEFMESNVDIGMCAPKLIDESGHIQLAYREYPTVLDMFIRFFCKDLFPERVKKHTLQDRDFSKVQEIPFAQGSFLVIRTELFRKLDGFDDGFFMYLEDADLCRRVNQISKLVYYPGTEAIHRWEQGSHKNIALFKAHVHSMRYYFKKWGLKLG